MRHLHRDGVGVWLERRLAWARKIGASMLVILFGALLSNFDLVTHHSPVYDVIGGPVTSLAIVWLLLAVDLRSVRAAGPRMMLAFGTAVVATAVGAVVAAFAMKTAFPDDTWRLAGVMTGTYSGGSLNFVAVGREVGLTEALFTAAAAADNLLTGVWMGATLVLPVWLRRVYPARKRAGNGDAGTSAFAVALKSSPLRILDVLVLLSLGFAILLAADGLSRLVPAVPGVLWITTLALAAAQLPGLRALAGALPLGLLGLNLFFVIIGIGSRVAEIARVGIEVFWFTAIVVGVHGLLLFTLARLVRLDAETTAVASQAAVGGPSTAMALATSRGWADLALPGLLVGLLGYAVGNYSGLAIAYALRGVLAGG
jgi:uncharacterized membrane protein